MNRGFSLPSEIMQVPVRQVGVYIRDVGLSFDVQDYTLRLF
jgi:hypothetical protein